MKNNSRNGMQSTAWGPSLWFFLHIVSFNYPEKPTSKHKMTYYKFVCNLKYVLPCKFCRDNFRKNLKKLNFSVSHLRNRLTFSKFIYDLHNIVNKETNKKEMKDFDKLCAFYETLRSGNKQKKVIIRIYNL